MYWHLTDWQGKICQMNIVRSKIVLIILISNPVLLLIIFLIFYPKNCIVQLIALWKLLYMHLCFSSVLFFFLISHFNSKINFVTFAGKMLHLHHLYNDDFSFSYFVSIRYENFKQFAYYIVNNKFYFCYIIRSINMFDM